MASAGKVLIIPKGNWDETAAYEMLDLVYYGGTSWIAKKSSTGIAPGHEEYWQKMFDYNEYMANNS